MNLRKFKGTIMMAATGAAALLAGGMLFLIVGQFFLAAIPSLTPHFILSAESSSGGLGTGIANAIVGTIFLAVMSTMLAIPFGVGTAIYLQKYAPDNHITRFLRLMIEVLSGTPSIVLGMFGVMVLVVYLKPITGGESLIAGSVALAILTLPVIERATEDAIARVPRDLEEGSYALGATKWLTIRNIVIPFASSGIIVGAILGFGRAAEESAVVVLTAGYSQYLPEFRIALNPQFLLGIKIYPLNHLVGSLPAFLYIGYENANVFPISSIFAAGFVLIMIVMIINLSAKGILFYATGQGNRKNGLSSLFRSVPDALRGKKPKDMTSHTLAEIEPMAPQGVFSEPEESPSSGILAEPVPGPQFSPDADAISIVTPTTKPPGLSQSLQWIRTVRRRFLISDPDNKDNIGTRSDTTPKNHDRSRNSILPFFRALLPFVIPAILLLIIAYFATIPPLHAILGPATPSLAGLYATGLAGIVTVAGLIFGLLFAKRDGAFRAQNRRTGCTAVAAGFCLLCITGIICSSAAAGLFNTGEQTTTQSGADRSAKLAAMLASGELGDETGSAVSIQGAAPTTPVPTAVPTQAPSAALTVTIPVKDALSLGESYRFGDATRICDATVYDYRILPFYYWWWVDWNRFVEQDPQPGNKYLVIFIRIEDIGMNSAILPSADQFQISNNNNTYTHLPYMNVSLLSTDQLNDYSNFYASNPLEIPYQWIRELGQDRRDYAFLTGYNIFGNPGSTTSGIVNVTPTTITTTTTFNEVDVATNNGQGYSIKPGASNAIDGYLIYEIPESAVNTTGLNQTYVDISFNANSGTRWRLK